jgi:hypothetical protein
VADDFQIKRYCGEGLDFCIGPVGHTVREEFGDLLFLFQSTTRTT